VILKPISRDRPILLENTSSRLDRPRLWNYLPAFRRAAGFDLARGTGLD
jgi:hypothetical protein